jgi:hypothetical protein
VEVQLLQKTVKVAPVQAGVIGHSRNVPLIVPHQFLKIFEPHLLENGFLEIGIISGGEIRRRPASQMRGKELHVQDFLFMKRHDLLQQMDQLPDISGPGVIPQEIHGLGSHPFYVAIQLSIQPIEKVTDQQRDVL